MARDLQYAQAAIRRLLRSLDKPESLAHDFATQILAQARQNAASKPTPQARMAADNMRVEVASIVPASSGPASDVAIGSEFGSTVYAQFHRGRNPRGYWLFPAGQLVAQRSGQETLDDVLRRAVSG